MSFREEEIEIKRSFDVGKISASIVISGLLVTSGTAVASAAESGDGTSPEIVEFAERVENSFGIVIDPTAYEIRTECQDRFIVRTDARDVHSETGRSEDLVREEISPGKTSPPTAREVRDQVENGLVTIQQETVWYQPECSARLQDPDGAGYMDTCWQWGDMNYSGQTRNNWGFRMYGTCAPKDDAWFTELVECYVDTVRTPGSTALVWNDWSPKSTTNLGGCGNVSLSIGIGPVSASANVATCEELIPEKGAAAGDMRVRWVGDAYWDGDIRETGSLIGIGSSFGTSPSLDLSYGYYYSGCNPPPDLIDQCG